jgi:hypothetical protein
MAVRDHVVWTVAVCHNSNMAVKGSLPADSQQALLAYIIDLLLLADIQAGTFTNVYCAKGPSESSCAGAYTCL